MPRLVINVGSSANDGTGDTLRSTGTKLNSMFSELYNVVGIGDSSGAALVSFDGETIVFQGGAVDSNYTVFSPIAPTGINIITIPDQTGEIILSEGAQTANNKTLKTVTLTAASISDNDSSHTYNIIGGALTANHNINIPSLVDSDTFVLTDVGQTLLNKTLTTPTITNPIMQGQMFDSTGINVFQVTSDGVGGSVVRAYGSAGVVEIRGFNGDSAVNASLTLRPGGDSKVQIAGRVGYTYNTITTTAQTVYGAPPVTLMNNAANITATLANATTTFPAAGGEAPSTAEAIGTAKRIVNISSSGNVTVTPTTFENGTSFTLRPGGIVDLMWISAARGWFIASPTLPDSSETNALWYINT